MHILPWILVLVVISQVRGDGVLKLHLTRYSNPNGIDAEGDRCDTTMGIRTSDCDPYFIICVTSTGSSACNLKSITTGVYRDQNDIDFRSDLGGGITNPIIITFRSWPARGVQLSTQVYDEDSRSGHDLLDTMVATITASPASSSVTGVYRDVTLRGTSSTLYTRVLAYCDADWYGSGCDTYCVSTDDTSGHYSCSDTGEKTCIPGWEGSDCTADTDECMSTPCEHGGECTNLQNSYSCQCVKGYEGTRCEINIDECASSPCQNGATCIDDVNVYSCTCAEGFQGYACEDTIDYCIGVNCQNGGKCEQVIGKAWCTCAQGFTGSGCESNIDDCHPDPCEGDESVCTDLVNDFVCQCDPYRTGPTCADVIPTTSQPLTTESSPCASSPCARGTCDDVGMTYTCNCPSGYTGTQCTEIDVCSRCVNGGSCEDGSDVCMCPVTWTGTLCDVAIGDACSDSPCLNMGACLTTDDGFVCQCAAGYAGDRCEIGANKCGSVPCQNGGSCEQSEDEYKCVCTTHFYGDNCEFSTYKEDPTKPQVMLFEGKFDDEFVGQLEVSILELVSEYYDTPTTNYRLTYDTQSCRSQNDTTVTVVVYQVLDENNEVVPWYVMEEIFASVSPEKLNKILPRPLYDGNECSKVTIDESKSPHPAQLWPIVVGVVAVALAVGIIAAVIVAYKRRKARSGRFDVITNPAYDQQDRRGTTDTLLGEQTVEQSTRNQSQLPVYFRSHSQEYPNGTLIDFDD